MKKINQVKKSGILELLAIVLSAALLLSFIPVVVSYLRKAPSYYTNDRAIEKLASNSGECFEFIVFGDNHAGLIFNDSAALKLARHMNREDRFRKTPVDFALSLGDITFRSSEWDYKNYNKLRAVIKYPVISAMGNHDNDEGGEERFKKYIGPDEFSFADRNSYFIVVNSTSNNLAEEQFERIENELKKSMSYKHRFVILHKAPFSPYQQSWYRPELSEWSYRLMKLCEKYRVDIVFSGHEHMFKDETFGGVKYLISGGGGMLLYLPQSAGGYLHYLVIKVRGDYVSFEVRRIFPPFWEYVTYYLWKEIFYLLLWTVY